jgi:hypothetical protein
MRIMVRLKIPFTDFVFDVKMSAKYIKKGLARFLDNKVKRLFK